MKNIVTTIIISVLLMIPLSCRANAYNDCIVDEENIDMSQSGFMPISSTLSIASTSYNIYRPTDELVRCEGAPSPVGDMRVVVIPIEFADTNFLQEDLDLMQDKFFGDRNRDAKMLEELSVKDAFDRLSYGKLNVSGSVLPVYKAPEIQNYYNRQTVMLELIKEAIASYTDVDFSEYDGNGDGYVDAICVEYCDGDNEITVLPSDNAWGSYAFPNGISPYVELPGGVKARPFTYMRWTYGLKNSQDMDLNFYSGTEIHELLHLFGLPDLYFLNDRYYVPTKCNEILGGYSYAYVNMYYKYILGWISEEDGGAVFLTYDDVLNGDGLKEIELCPAEKYGEEAEGKTKAVFIIPDKNIFPSVVNSGYSSSFSPSEFYVIEYRPGGTGWPKYDYFVNNPGVIIWHCAPYTNIRLPSLKHNVIVPVCKSNSGKEYDPPKDLYFEGDEFSPETTPSSNFYDDVYTGAYMKVLSIDSEKATILSGFKELDIPPAPTITISPPSQKAVKSGEEVEYQITYETQKKLVV